MAESPFRERGPVSDEVAIDVLTHGDMEILGRMPWSSNGTFLVDVCRDDHLLQGVYKPLRGERPLWDFPDGLYKREVASFLLNQALGWRVIPPTVLRGGPLDEGSVQLFIPCDYDRHYFELLEDPANHPTLMQMCVFDVIANSTDRKAGHCVLDASGLIYGIDNGLTLHAEYKLRTVIWDWAGEDLPEDLRTDVAAFLDTGVPEALAKLLNPFEVDAMLTRARGIVREGRFPVDPSGQRWPWPLI